MTSYGKLMSKVHSQLSLFNVLNGTSNRVEDWRIFWDPSVMQKVLVFCELVRWNKILTIDKS